MLELGQGLAGTQVPHGRRCLQECQAGQFWGWSRQWWERPSPRCFLPLSHRGPCCGGDTTAQTQSWASSPAISGDTGLQSSAFSR